MSIRYSYMKHIRTKIGLCIGGLEIPFCNSLFVLTCAAIFDFWFTLIWFIFIFLSSCELLSSLMPKLFPKSL